MVGFWGEPTCHPEDGEVAKFITQIRELTKNHPPERRLAIATASLHAIALFIANIGPDGPREFFAITDALRAKIGGVV